MKKKRVVIYDNESDYAYKLWDFIRSQKRVPWETFLYTDWKKFSDADEEECDILLVAERSYKSELTSYSYQKIIILNETGRVLLKNLQNIEKYQPASEIYRYLLEAYEEMAGEDMPMLHCGEKTKFIGIYSPVKRCLQTNFALTMGQILAAKHTCLYLNLEHYAGDGELTKSHQNRDLADLLYFLDAKQDKFALRLQIMTEKKGNLDYIPPMKEGQDLLSVQGKDWLRFLEKLEKTGAYEYIIMDLSDSIQGLFDILRVCRKVYTITKDDRIAKGKILQYEQLLSAREFEDVLAKTRKCSLPLIKSLPLGIEQYTRGDLALYVKKELEQLLAE